MSTALCDKALAAVPAVMKLLQDVSADCRVLSVNREPIGLPVWTQGIRGKVIDEVLAKELWYSFLLC